MIITLKAENPKKFRKKKSLEEELIKMREDKAGLK